MSDRADTILRKLKLEKELKDSFSEKSMQTAVKREWKSFTLLVTFLHTVGRLLWKIFNPFYRFFQYLIMDVVWKNYKKLWARYAYKDANGTRRFSKLYGMRTLIFTIISAFIIYQSIFFFADLSLYVLTAKANEVVYLTNAQEILPEYNVHSVQGCLATMIGDNLTCSVDEGLYFRIGPSLFAEIWSLVNKHELFFPDYVAAPIAPVWQKCTVTSYGFRAKFFIRGLDIYPNLLNATCQKI